jgi:hypothetical protein
MSERSIEVVYVDAQTLRQRFNALDYYGAVARGELTPVITRNHLARPDSGMPVGTRSQFLFYMRGQSIVAKVHQYLLPDGSLGASGLPDPKWLRDGKLILKLADS